MCVSAEPRWRYSTPFSVPIVTITIIVSFFSRKEDVISRQLSTLGIDSIRTETLSLNFSLIFVCAFNLCINFKEQRITSLSSLRATVCRSWCVHTDALPERSFRSSDFVRVKLRQRFFYIYHNKCVDGIKRFFALSSVGVLSSYKICEQDAESWKFILLLSLSCYWCVFYVMLSPVYSDTTQLNSTQLPVVDPPTARRRFWTSWPSWSSLWVMTSCMTQNSHEIREFVWLYDRIDIMESWTEELENKLIEL